jgi:hypothetical protein
LPSFAQAVPSGKARIEIDGTIEWRDGDGKLHRVGGPARVFPSGREEWFAPIACIVPMRRR